MSNGHFSTSGPYRVDAKTEFYRAQEEERADRERVERGARWIAGKLQGHQYDTPQAMERSVVELVETIQGGECDEEMLGTIKKAVTMIWLGESDRDAMYRRCVVKSETGIRFEAA